MSGNYCELASNYCRLPSINAKLGALGSPKLAVRVSITAGSLLGVLQLLRIGCSNYCRFFVWSPSITANWPFQGLQVLPVGCSGPFNYCELAVPGLPITTGWLFGGLSITANWLFHGGPGTANSR